jgi:hypothetical protein
MGLLDKALSARSEESRPQGLLKRSIDLAEPPAPGVLVTQQELDALLRSRPAPGPSPAPEVQRAGARPPAAVPLTWTAAGLAAPAGDTGPTISQEELESVLAKGLPAGGTVESPTAKAPMTGEAPAGQAAVPENDHAESPLPVEALPEGLLASATKTKQASPPDEGDPVKAASARLLPAIRSLPRGIELPAAVFSQIVSGLSLVKAAFLLYDPLRMAYAPWASVGYDETTLHRLRISLGANPSFNSISNGTPAVVAGKDDLGQYQKYFSSREFSQISSLLLVPFIHEEKLIGVVMVSESQGPLSGTKELMELLASIASESAPMIHAAREAKLASLASPSIGADGRGEKELDAFLETARGENRKVLLLSLSLAGLLKAVMGRASHIDAFRLREDIRTILNGFLAGLGKAFALPAAADTWILAVRDGRKTDAHLLLHQLAAYLERVFAGVDASDTVNPAAAHALGWPEECGDVREILARLTA